MHFEKIKSFFNKDINTNEYNYSKILIKTFFQYSWFASPNKILPKEPRIFPKNIKEQCWNNSKKIPGRDPNRWRYDALGNPVLKNLRGCGGIFSHDYDHIYPFSKGGKSNIENCQILQTNINRMKSDQTLNTKEFKNYKLQYPTKLKEILSKNNNQLSIGDLEMDIAEELIYGNIKKI